MANGWFHTFLSAINQPLALTNQRSAFLSRNGLSFTSFFCFRLLFQLNNGKERAPLVEIEDMRENRRRSERPSGRKDRNITARYLFRTQITGTIPTLDYNFIIRLTFLSNVRIMRDESKVGDRKVGSSCVSEKSERCFMVFPSLRSMGLD